MIERAAFGDEPTRSPRPPSWPGLGRWLAAAAFATLALAMLVIGPSCTLPRMGDGSALGPDAGGNAGECEEPADCPGLFLDCRWPTCDAGSCGTAVADSGTDCDEDDGRVCNAQGLCVECIQGGDYCGDGEICQSNLCVPASCGDGTQNSGESDVDCGGPCAPCANGQSCGEASDCQSGYCAGGTCAPCTVTEDCEADRWCDAGVCVPDKADGDTCSTDEQCSSGFCPEDDGACCNQACDGTCQACVGGFTGLPSGQCGPVLAGDDPDQDCPDQGAASCGSNGTGCNGSGACQLYPSGTVCVGPSCTAGERQRPDTCSGTGTCEDNGIETCSPYQCSGTDCRSSCTDDSHCLSGSYCNAPNCVSKGGQGDPCGGDNECSSGHCIDGYCCVSSCAGECMACSNAKTGLDNGLCRSIPTGTDPDGECTNGACYRLDPTDGECRFGKGHVCSGSVLCLTLPCVDGYCCENACTGDCLSCDGAETIGGNGDCAAVTTGDDPDGDCPDQGATSCGSNGTGCDGAGACRLYPSGTVCVAPTCDSAYVLDKASLCNGSGSCVDSGTENCSPYPCSGTACAGSCTNHTDCASGYFCNGSNECQAVGQVGDSCPGDYACANDQCVDGYCCDSACSDQCDACNLSGSEGTCTAVAAGEPGSPTCAPYLCSGGAGCSTTCGDSGDCASGNYCDSSSHCVALQSNGAVCTGDGSTCTSGHCVDGFCCESACTENCKSCNGANTVGNDGECAFVTANTDPDTDCPGAASDCDGAGNCT